MTDYDVEQMSEKEVKAGDLVFFSNLTAPHYVGGYIGMGERLTIRIGGL